VGVFIDGVYQGRAGMSVGDLLDIEAVEVLRGPQGTLWGKNTAAGAINIRSKRPAYDPAATLEHVIGNYDNYEGRMSLNVPIVDERIATRFSAYRTVRDGFDVNVFDGSHVNDDNRWGLKSRTVFDVSDALSFLVTGDYSDQDDTCCVADVITYEGAANLWPTAIFQRLEMDRTTPGPQQPIPTITHPLYDPDFELLPKADPFDRVVGADQSPYNKVQIGGLAVEGTYEFFDNPLISGSTLKFIGAWRHYELDSLFDGDFSIFNAVLAFTETALDQYSAELIFTSPGEELFDYQAGFFFYHQTQNTIFRNGYEFDFNRVNVFLPSAWIAAGEAVFNIDKNTHETFSYAGFGQGTLNLGEHWRLTGGLRVTHEKKTRVGLQTSNFPNIDAPPILGPDIFADQERSVTNLSGLATVRFTWDDLMAYASFSNGFKSGGFNQLRTMVGVSGEFDDENSKNYELGIKTSWFQRMLTLNATGFYTDYDDFQAQVFDGSSINVLNAGSLESYGLEAELVVVPLPQLIIGGTVGYNVAKYASFEQGPLTAEQRAAATNGNPILCFDERFADVCVRDLTGARLDNVPRLSIGAFSQIETPGHWLPFQLFLRGEYAYNSMRYLDVDLDPNLRQPPTHVVNLRGGVRAEDGLWELTVWAKNLTDEQYNVVGLDIPILNGFVGINAPPRQYGLTVRIKLGGDRN
jgi:iron complex outermembrane receptor protein